MRIAQIGVGNWGAGWIHQIQRNTDWTLAAVIDSNESRARQVAADVGLAATDAFPSLKAMIEAQIEVDAVLVAVPPVAHTEVTVEALEAGYHCLIEKPLADTLDDARTIVAAADKAQRSAMVSQNYRFKRAARTVRRLISEGVVGDVESVNIVFKKDPPFDGFRLEMDEPLLMDMSIHHLDLLRAVIPAFEPARVRATSWNPSWSRFDGNACATVEIESRSGARAIYTGSWASRSSHTTWDGSWDIEGTDGALTWADNEVIARPASVFDTVFLPGALEQHGSLRVDLDPSTQEERQGVLAEFAAAIHEGRRPETDAHDNLWSLALVEAAVRSASLGGSLVDVEQLVQSG
ncbi:Gfo/Idh/MocA family oxidoreductase [Rhodococcus sp. IEGM 248]|nr:Gfo/Idh/MocA family oxidoreductase [Rhodococcus sp. IEGM 248]